MGLHFLVKFGLWVVMIVLVHVSGLNGGCLEEERRGLLEFKEFLKSNGADADYLLPSWVENNSESDCCDWERVTCNSTSGHVTELSLDNVKDVDYYIDDRIWFINSSLFLPFKELRSLNLSFNSFSGLIDNEDRKLLSKLSKLRYLDLSNNTFNKDIFRILDALPSLKFLSLEFNDLQGPLSNQELTYNLSNLEVLLLSNNLLNGTLPMEGLASLRHLEVLDLSWNFFSGSIPPSIGALSSLKALSFAHNYYLNGSLPIHGLCELKKLEELDLSENLFEGVLPPCLSNLRSLMLFDLSSNQFTGNNSSSLLGSLNSLEYIDFSHNRFDGLFSFSSFANHSKLEVVSFASDNDKLEVEPEHADWIPTFQLKVLVLSNCNLNKLSGGGIPKFLLHQKKLRIVDLSHNHLEGSFPNWLLENNMQLEFVNLRNNSFVGKFSLLPYHYINISLLDVSDNNFSGQIQTNVGEMLPYITSINLSRNAFEGGIPSSIGKMSQLEVLDLSMNNLSGEVPKQLLRDCRSLRVLILSNNSFHGRIFSADFNLSEIERLHLNDNQFTGPLTNLVFNLSALELLDISNNNMSGKIPGSMDAMTGLRTLNIQNNLFDGQFPCALVPYVFMNASHNSFAGSLFSCSNSNLQLLKHMHLQGNKFTGFISKALLNLSMLLTLDLRDNSLSGSIPASIKALSSLRILLLKGNQLGGSIPSELCQLYKISLMDLSINSFIGFIPHCFSNITFRMIGTRDHAYMKTDVYGYSRQAFYYKYGGLLEFNFEIHGTDNSYDNLDEVEFVTKGSSYSYRAGSVLNYMSGLDLSCNKLTGEIPFELGKLSNAHTLNLSHNHLTGPIPKTFSSLANMESLDLSYNKLSGNIPTELINLNFMSRFIVAHNNLSGKIPDMKAQFGTFETSNYEGNPFLCGPPLEKSCTPNVDSPTASSNENEVKWYDINPVDFSASFAASYIVFLLGFATILYINRYWRQRWFYLVEEGMYSSYYLVSDTLHKVLKPSV